MNSVIRYLLGTIGVGVGIFGALQLWDIGTDNLFETGKWLVGGVVLHDGIIGPVTIGVAVAVTWALRGRLPAPVIVGGIVLGAVTLATIPMLGRFGARADNATLLPRNYVAGWLVLAALTLVIVAVALLLNRRSTNGGEHGTGTGG